MPRPALLRTLVLLLAACASPAAAESEETMVFSREASEVRAISKPVLREACGVRTVEVEDPYYATRKRFVACPLERVLELGFGDAHAVGGADVLLRAVDGYTRAVSGDQLLIAGAFLAFEDADTEGGGFLPIGRRQVDAGPFYLIWQGAGRSDPSAWPWPFQLATIEIAPFAINFPHTVPVGAAEDSAASRGFTLFRRECFSCHAINGEGGKVGPDLNVPQSITSYRPAAQIRAFVRNPQTFRYTTMPSHEHLAEADLDDLLAYLVHMSGLQHDPGGPHH